MWHDFRGRSLLDQKVVENIEPSEYLIDVQTEIPYDISSPPSHENLPAPAEMSQPSYKNPQPIASFPHDPRGDISMQNPVLPSQLEPRPEREPKPESVLHGQPEHSENILGPSQAPPNSPQSLVLPRRSQRSRPPREFWKVPPLYLFANNQHVN